MKKGLVEFLSISIFILFIGIYLIIITKIGQLLTIRLSIEEAEAITLGLFCLFPFTSILPALYLTEKLEDKIKNELVR